MIKDGLAIKVFSGDLQGALRVFQRRTQNSGFIGEIKRKNAFVPKGERLRLKAQRAETRKNRHRKG